MPKRANQTSFKRGSRHPRWQGGTYVTEQGYLRYSAGPLRNRLVHRCRLELLLGRELTSGEVAHHTNWDKRDNSPNNLDVLSKPLHDALPVGAACMSARKFIEVLDRAIARRKERT